ncbi:threonine-phosphate decarboxylase CobD [Halococcoides cellulosivorans]|uniref:L-threonine-O-3-phosphate decarboxylase n=1 Tax=Halococcoides cellulosivorans TaxID=1679096 RepID=A0A2R4X153_9EURY|nr:threonine-phosphate decarboxylase CobD [Halococcoides cellulosivorans]AWB27511.1 threonine-phosphate decarboxylase [Halococcoides cellulosivorans]
MNRDRALDLDRVTHGGSTADVIDFSANVNPRTPPGVEAVFRRALERSRSYPPEPPARFRQAAARAVDVQPAQVIPTPGGLAALRLTLALAVEAGDRALVPAPSFGEYAREVRLQGGRVRTRDPRAVLDADPGPFAVAVVCRPNNPTGWCPERDRLRSFAERCRAAGTLLVVDEAFLGYTDRPTLAGTPGTVVLRSLTKLYGLPGLRAGYAVATDDWRDALASARRPWNVGVPALAVGAHCLGQRTFVAQTRERVRAERARLADALDDRFDVRPSDAPFVLVEVPGSVDDLLANCRERGVVLRDARTFDGLDSHVRIAIRTPAENDRFLEAIHA